MRWHKIVLERKVNYNSATRGLTEGSPDCVGDAARLIRQNQNLNIERSGLHPLRRTLLSRGAVNLDRAFTE